ncbi:MAG: OprO/OprP family phosphate-selective porin [Fimbriiglobus sp.]|jgi:phosphate-selective porin OprO/OprP|nr:OprO/OprP family phosphate-selective porin [Fimbriiglobus sp.]
MPTRFRTTLLMVFIVGLPVIAQPVPDMLPAPGPVATRPTAPPLPISLPDLPPLPPAKAKPAPNPLPLPLPPALPLLGSLDTPPRATDRVLALEPYWNDGLFLRTADRRLVAHLGGMLHYDAAWFSGGRSVQDAPGGVGRFFDSVNPRRLRLLADGAYRDTFDFRLEVEFMNGVANGFGVTNSPVPGDAYVTVWDLPWLGNVRVGNQKEWFSLERLTGANNLIFLERSPLADFSANAGQNVARSPGISAFRTWANDSLFTAVGVYKNIDNPLGVGIGDGEYAVTGRVAALPVWLPEAQTYWHVGGAMSHRDPVGGVARAVGRGAVRNAPFALLNLIADSGPITADGQTLFNLESAFASGPLTVSGEFTANLIDRPPADGGTLAYKGFYAQASYFLTGEHRDWDARNGVFRRVTPLRPFDPRAGSWGGWEVGGRFSLLDLDDGGVNGGRASGVTLGLTWYLSTNVRWQVNYDYLYRNGGPDPTVRGSIHSLGTRLALDF